MQEVQVKEALLQGIGLEWPYQPDPFIQQTFGMPKLAEAHPEQGVAIVSNQEDPVQNEPHPSPRPAGVALV
ncbi:hypothetical protein L3X38_026793 [Prunus dulcis]|uniref:Uncharacterized protein n=1 Tax=Prunus dulcis TaxID=3755 RepID=A0AAD4YYU7_PRUDU|nr:hypothetical protein L3X38_026793 [Prunus dulcis]